MEEWQKRAARQRMEEQQKELRRLEEWPKELPRLVGRGERLVKSPKELQRLDEPGGRLGEWQKELQRLDGRERVQEEWQEERERRLDEREGRLEEQQRRLEEQQRRLEEQQKRLEEQQRRLEEQQEEQQEEEQKEWQRLEEQQKEWREEQQKEWQRLEEQQRRLEEWQKEQQKEWQRLKLDDALSSIQSNISHLNLKSAEELKIPCQDGRSLANPPDTSNVNVSIAQDHTETRTARGSLPGHQPQDRANIISSSEDVPGAKLPKAEPFEVVGTAPLHEDLVQLEGSPSVNSLPSPLSDGELSFIATQESDQGSPGNSEDARNDLVEIQSMLVAGMFLEYVNAARECGFRSRAHTESQASSSLVTEPPSRHVSSTAAVQSAVSRGKRARANSDDEDDDSDRRKARQKQKIRPDSEYTSEKVFACPFSKFDPSRYSERNTVEKNYRGCSSCFLTDIPRVKQHLYRKHKRPDHYCGSCFQTFDTHEALDAHSRQRPACDLAEPRFAEKMTRDQLNSIKRRSPGKDACETWFNIFRILFPGATPPDSPFCEAASPTTVHTFSRRFRARAPAMLSALVRTRLQGHVLITDYEQQILDNALEDCLSDVVQYFAADFDEVEAVLAAASSASIAGPAGPLPPTWASHEDSYDTAAQREAPNFWWPAPAHSSTWTDWEDIFVNPPEDEI